MRIKSTAGQVTRSTGIVVSSISGLALRRFSTRSATNALYSSLAGLKFYGEAYIKVFPFSSL